MIKYIHIILVIWVFVVAVSSGFGESFNGRPTEAEMDELVTLGTESGHGVYERCYATQYSTNSAYYVSPPSFIGMNGWYLSPSVMQALDDKVKALVPYCVDMNTVYNGTANITMLTVPGVWAELGIGDYVNQFTGTPAIGTNPPTYGDYPWRTYAESLQERYQVLNALTATRDYRVASVNGSKQGNAGAYLTPEFDDLNGQAYTDVATETEYIETYNPYSQAYVLGLENGYDYESDTNYVHCWHQPSPPQYYYHKMSYAELQTYATWAYMHHMIIEYEPPWSDYPDGYIAPTNLTGLGVGGWLAFTKSPYVGGATVSAWHWWDSFVVEYSTWVFNKQYPGQQLSNTVALYLKPTLPSLPTADSWYYPRSWDVVVDGRFEELVEMPTNVFTKMDNAFAVVDGSDFSVEFGSDQFDPITTEGSLQSFPDAPTEGVDGDDNTGSVGTMKGSYVAPNNYFFLKTWQFNYCTE